MAACGEIIEHRQLDTREAVWRIHLFVGVRGVPGGSGQPATVAVVQISHAFADGTRSAALAGLLLGRNTELPPVNAPALGGRVVSVIDALRRRRELHNDTVAGVLPAAAGPLQPLRTNRTPSGPPLLRTFVRHRFQLPGKSATVGALVAISEALGGYLRDRGEDVSTLTALVPMAKPGVAQARNHSAAEFIRLHPDVVSRTERARLIAEEFDSCRRRRLHSAFGAQEAAMASLPGPLLRWLASRPLPDAVMAHTVVSSVNRGAADLHFGGCPVFMTAGYPFLTPTIALTHGVHGIGDMVAISVHTRESVMPDIADYLDRLNAGLRPLP
ncbi:WS/DGAT domain-containing protein [Mycolicibacterium sp. CBM1]